MTIYTSEYTIFRIFSTSENVKLAIYEDDVTHFRKVYTMRKNDEGIYEFNLHGDCDGLYYTFIIDEISEVTDPYCKASSANSKRSCILNMENTHPDGWLEHKNNHKNDVGLSDAIICELHVRDFSIDVSSGTLNKGKYISFCETDTFIPETNISTCVDHLVELGVTHVHLLPVYDYITVDETTYDKDVYNWGYDPELYDVPEGSYATSTKDPRTRIIELKMLVMALQKRGIKVVLDVVYNHTFKSSDSNFHVLAPGHYHRLTEDGYFSNGSGVGNEFYSDSPLGREFLVNSLLYWQDEYNIDGFRFDLMALIDYNTIDIALAKLKVKDPNVVIYGEPWMGGLSVLKESERVYKGIQSGKGYALFNDSFRDAIKGDNDGSSPGYVQQSIDCVHNLMVGVTGSIQFSEHIRGFTKEPSESINYFNSHDNLILHDKLMKSTGNNESLVSGLTKMCFSILMTSQGVPFFHLGNEFGRHKYGQHNSYNASDDINKVDWTLKEKNSELYNYVRGLIQMRKDREEFKIKSADEIIQRLIFLKPTQSDLIVSYAIASKYENAYLVVVHNPTVKQNLLEVTQIKKQILETKTFFEIATLLDEGGYKNDNLNFTDTGYLTTAPLSTSVHILRVRNEI